ncbi:MAG: FAD-binding oxidoreductase [Deltaproteobacteria bacterium]|nr:FAD-binding oxidoreductase [Deltaproteobacteria bacterium]
MDRIYEKLAAIVGKEFISNAPEERYLYARDQGVQQASAPDYVVMPDSTEEVRQIVLLANEERIPVVPMGGALVLSGLTIPLRGGIVLDMKRMNRILEVNEASHYVVVEAGASHGMLQAYLKKHHPAVKHSVPDAPPVATVGGNMAIHGSGHLSQSEGGFHSEMVTGLEVVLGTGEVLKLGSCSTVPKWFSRAPLPDLAGLFLGWNGTTGVITKIGMKLFPSPKLKDVMMFMTEDIDSVTDILFRVIGTEMAEDIAFFVSPMPAYFDGFQLLMVSVVANSEKEMRMRKELIRDSVQSYLDDKEAGFLPLPPHMKVKLVEAPQKNLSEFADVMKGGGFEYVGAIMPVEAIPEAYRAGLKITEKYNITYSMGARVVGRGHSVMFYYAYPFNRADKENMGTVAKALEETNEAALEMGGIPWKTEVSGQQLILERMEPGTYHLMTQIRKLLDPNGIMNPGNWEVRS